ncbi:MAG: hypothetical protein AAFP23_04830, partial [Pseudomonadota bacterium]
MTPNSLRLTAALLFLGGATPVLAGQEALDYAEGDYDATAEEVSPEDVLDPPIVGVLADVEGLVTVTTEDGEIFIGEDGMPVREGDEVETFDDSKATVDFVDDSEFNVS